MTTNLRGADDGEKQMKRETNSQLVYFLSGAQIISLDRTIEINKNQGR